MTRPIQPAAAGRTLTLAKRHTLSTTRALIVGLDMWASRLERELSQTEAEMAAQRIVSLIRDLAAALRAEGGKR